MAFSYPADQQEAALARLVFGPTVTDVVFYDPDFPEDDQPWLAIGFEGDCELAEFSGLDAGKLPRQDGLGLFDIPGERGETVKFWLSIPPASDER